MDRASQLDYQHPDLFLRHINRLLRNEEADISDKAATIVENFAWTALIELIDRAYVLKDSAKKKANSALLLDHVTLAYKDLPDEYALSSSEYEEILQKVNEHPKREILGNTNDIVSEIHQTKTGEDVGKVRIYKDAEAFINYYIKALISEVTGRIVFDADNRKHIKEKDVRRVIKPKEAKEAPLVWVVRKQDIDQPAEKVEAVEIVGVFDSPEQAYSKVFEDLKQEIIDDKYTEWLDKNELEDNDKNWKKFFDKEIAALKTLMKPWETASPTLSRYDSAHFTWEFSLSLYVLSAAIKY